MTKNEKQLNLGVRLPLCLEDPNDLITQSIGLAEVSVLNKNQLDPSIRLAVYTQLTNVTDGTATT